MKRKKGCTNSEKDLFRPWR